jgi:hypothetical protein
MSQRQQLQAALTSVTGLEQHLSKVKNTLSLGQCVDMGEETIDAWMILVKNAKEAIKKAIYESRSG